MDRYLVSFDYQVIGGPWMFGHLNHILVAASAQNAVDIVAQRVFDKYPTAKLQIISVYKEIVPEEVAWRPNVRIPSIERDCKDESKDITDFEHLPNPYDKHGNIHPPLWER